MAAETVPYGRSTQQEPAVSEVRLSIGRVLPIQRGNKQVAIGHRTMPPSPCPL